MDHAKLLLRLFVRPSFAMGEILDRGSLLFASLAVLVISYLETRTGFAFSFYAPLLVLSVFYVPGTLLLCKLFGALGGGVNATFPRDYSPLLTCTAMAAAAASLPVLVAAWVLPAFLLSYVAAAAGLYFAVLMFFAVRTVLGAGNGSAAAVVALSWIPLVAAAFLWGPLRYVLGWIASPFFLFFVIYFLWGEIGNLGAGLRRQQHFQRMLQAAAVNPHDGEAQYQLGLVYQHRHQYNEAVHRFQNAVAIDPTLADAHFQLGRLAREQGRLREALPYFQKVLDQDDRHSQSEILRELGAMYNSVRQYEDARQMLADYIERRPYDPEGLYHYGQALEGLNKPVEAREMYERAVEADRTAPRYRRRVTARWSRLAQKGLGRVQTA